MSENIKEIIEKISYYDGTFPKEELQTLLDNREAATPYLLDAIRNTDEVLDELLSDEDYFLPLYALFMLAQFRETEAYPLVYKLFSADGEKLDEAFDDFITGDFLKVLASVSGGDTSFINQLIEDEEVYEYVRTAAISSWLCLFRAGLKTREEVISYFKTLFEMPCEEDSFFRGTLVWCCWDLKAVELMPEIEKSYAEEKVELFLMGDWNEYQKLMAEPKSDFLEGKNKNYDLVDDMISALAGWYCFRDPQGFMGEIEDSEDDLREGEPTQRIAWKSNYGGTFVRETPKIGKNEPCPCESGRKFKKCCMNL